MARWLALVAGLVCVAAPNVLHARPMTLYENYVCR
jgi:hypothetical protein